RSWAAVLCYALAATIPVAGLLFTNYVALGERSLAYEKFGGPWYEYEDSYWKKSESDRIGLDWAGKKESRAVYALHLLVGHHGLFSLTPLYLLAAIGMVTGAITWLRKPQGNGWTPVAGVTLTVTVIVTGFFILVVQDRQRN